MTLPYTKLLDISQWQDNSQTPKRIDFSKPKLHNIKVIINRAVFSATPDRDFLYNWAQEKVHGYIRSAYGFWDYRPGNPGVVAQANALVNILKPDPGEFPIVWMDIERPVSTWPELPAPRTILAAMKQYAIIVESGLPGKTCGWYMNPAMIRYLMTNASAWNEYKSFILARPIWVAAWPDWTNPLNTGKRKRIGNETLDQWMERNLDWQPNIYGLWNKWLIWQYGTPSIGYELGMESKEVDVDFFNGTEQELYRFCNLGEQTDPEPNPDEGEEPKNMYTDNALGIYLNQKLDRALDGFHFVVARGGDKYGVNPIIRTITDKAKLAKIPVIIEYDYDPGYYTQYPHSREDLLPPLATDKVYQAFLNATNTTVVGDYQAISIRVHNELDQYNSVVDGSWISWGAQMFLKRVSAWRDKYKPGMKIFVNTSGDFIKEHAINMSNWINTYEPYVIQKSALMVGGSYPAEDQKPRYYTPTWKMWEYYGSGANFGLVLFNGGVGALEEYLKVDVVVTPPPTVPDPKPPVTPPVDMSKYVLKTDFDALATKFTNMESEVRGLKDALNQFIEDDSEHVHDTTVVVTVGKPKQV